MNAKATSAICFLCFSTKNIFIHPSSCERPGLAVCGYRFKQLKCVLIGVCNDLGYSIKNLKLISISLVLKDLADIFEKF